MEAEYKQSLEIYKSEKTKIIEELKNFKGQIEEKMKIFQNLKFLDDMIEIYTNKLKEGKKKIFIIFNKYRRRINNS